MKKLLIGFAVAMVSLGALFVYQSEVSATDTVNLVPGGEYYTNACPYGLNVYASYKRDWDDVNGVEWTFADWTSNNRSLPEFDATSRVEDQRRLCHVPSDVDLPVVYQINKPVLTSSESCTSVLVDSGISGQEAHERCYPDRAASSLVSTCTDTSGILGENPGASCDWNAGTGMFYTEYAQPYIPESLTIASRHGCTLTRDDDGEFDGGIDCRPE